MPVQQTRRDGLSQAAAHTLFVRLRTEPRDCWGRVIVLARPSAPTTTNVLVDSVAQSRIDTSKQRQIFAVHRRFLWRDV